jgi:hypothetical protein
MSAAENLGRFKLMKGAPGQRAIEHPALMVRPIAEHPGLADRAVGQGRAEKVGQVPTTPGPVLVDRREAERV